MTGNPPGYSDRKASALLAINVLGLSIAMIAAIYFAATQKLLWAFFSIGIIFLNFYNIYNVSKKIEV